MLLLLTLTATRGVVTHRRLIHCVVPCNKMGLCWEFQKLYWINGWSEWGIQVNRHLKKTSITEWYDEGMAAGWDVRGERCHILYIWIILEMTSDVCVDDWLIRVVNTLWLTEAAPCLSVCLSVCSVSILSYRSVSVSVSMSVRQLCVCMWHTCVYDWWCYHTILPMIGSSLWLYIYLWSLIIILTCKNIIILRSLYTQPYNKLLPSLLGVSRITCLQSTIWLMPPATVTAGR